MQKPRKKEDSKAARNSVVADAQCSSHLWHICEHTEYVNF